MPVYRFNCPAHGDYELQLSMSECRSGTCPSCGKVGARRFDTPHIYMDFRGGWDPVLNTNVETKADRERVLRERGLVRLKD